MKRALFAVVASSLLLAASACSSGDGPQKPVVQTSEGTHVKDINLCTEDGACCLECVETNSACICTKQEWHCGDQLGSGNTPCTPASNDPNIRIAE
jgi:hypothetical protein